MLARDYRRERIRRTMCREGARYLLTYRNGRKGLLKHMGERLYQLNIIYFCCDFTFASACTGLRVGYRR
jgi:hypothetical protein